MYCKERTPKHENHKPKKAHKNTPSFSSTLLDEICRSIEVDGTADSDDSGVHRETPTSGFRARSRTKEEENSRFSRACLVEKWMEKEIVAKKLENSLLLQDNDSLFFSSTPTYSDSSGAMSSSDSDFFGSSTRPKPVRTGLSPHGNECCLIDDYQNYEKNKVEEDSIKSKSRASKIYTNLKKLKQPLSPGAKLTSLINSFFAHMNRKKTKNVDKKKMCQEMSSPDKTTSSTCSSTSSFSRSCLSKNSSKSSDADRSVIWRDGMRRTVRFRLEQEAKPCGEKNVCNEGYDRYGRPPLPPNALRVQRKCDFSMFRKIHNDEDGDEDHALSESSSDLFELDHLSMFGNKDRFCEELPVYETTYFDRNRGLIH